MAWFAQGSEEYGEHGEMLLNFFLDDEGNNDRVVVRISELVRCLKHFRESVLSNDEHDYEHEMNGQLWAATLGSGKLTAEQVRDAVLDNFEEMHETYYDHWEPSTFDWQAIADELNAALENNNAGTGWALDLIESLRCTLESCRRSEKAGWDSYWITADCMDKYIEQLELAIAALGSGTCENVAPDYLDFLCSECGFVRYHSDENDTGDGNDWAFCPRCGKKVTR